MNIVVRIKNQEEIKHLADLGADVFLLDTDVITTKAIYPLEQNSMSHVIEKIKKINKKVYIFINKMIHETDLQILNNWLFFLKTQDVDGLVINDFTVYVMARDNDLSDKIIYQPGTMNTNAYDVIYLKDKIKGMTLSKEITLDEMKAMMDSSSDIEYSLLGHGYIDMFYSKRKLIKLYSQHKDLENFQTHGKEFTIEEKTREGIFYPILEDNHGTHIFRDKKLESFNEVKHLPFHDLFLERLFMDDQEYFDAIRTYHGQLSPKDFLDQYGQEYHKGFFYTRTEKTKGEKNEN